MLSPVDGQCYDYSNRVALGTMHFDCLLSFGTPSLIVISMNQLRAYIMQNAFDFYNGTEVWGQERMMYWIIVSSLTELFNRCTCIHQNRHTR